MSEATTMPTAVAANPIDPEHNAATEAAGAAAARSRAASRGLQAAWGIYLVLAALPAPLAIVGIWVGLLAETSDAELSNLFMLVNFGWLTVTVPVAFLIQRQLFDNYHHGKPVAPEKYVAGMLAIWLPLSVAGVVGMIGWIVARTPLLAIVPSILALLVFLIFHPTGAAMTKPVGDHDDPGVYEEPS